MKRWKTVLVLMTVALLFAAAPALAGTLDEIKARGYIKAGVNGGVFGFSMPDDKGVWQGLDVDTARAISAAVFGDADKVRFTALTAVQRLPALQSKEIDVLCRNTTSTLTRDTTNGLNFVQVNYYDGQGFLISKKLGVKSAKELSGATVCVLPGTTTELNAADFFRANRMNWKPVVIENTAELNKAFFAGRCDVLAARGPAVCIPKSPGLYHPSGSHLQGTPRSGGASRGRPVVRHRQLDGHGIDRGRGAGHYFQKCR